MKKLIALYLILLMHFNYKLNNKAVFEFNITLHNNINIADDEGDIILKSSYLCYLVIEN